MSRSLDGILRRSEKKCPDALSMLLRINVQLVDLVSLNRHHPDNASAFIRNETELISRYISYMLDRAAFGYQIFDLIWSKTFSIFKPPVTGTKKIAYVLEITFADFSYDCHFS